MNEWGFGGEIKSWLDHEFGQHPSGASPGARSRGRTTVRENERMYRSSPTTADRLSSKAAAG